jgi:D-amino-acid dehydrogenase
MAKVLVLGAGVIGVSSAYFLARAGHEVAVIDRQRGAGLETSYANGGHVSASHSMPWANPAVPLQVLKWLGRKDAPLVFHPNADPAMWAWGLRFLANCAPWRARANLRRILPLALHSRQVLKELTAETGLEYDQQSRGILHIFRDDRELSHGAELAAVMGEMGCELSVLDGAGCTALEPALAPAGDRIVGGIHSPGDISGDAYKFTARLAELSAEMGVQFRLDTPIRRISAMAGRVTGVMTTRGMFTADRYVVALGSYSPLYLRPLGIKIPVYPAKGYSVTLPITNEAKAPTMAITDDTFKLVYSRLGDRLRVAGTAEFDRYNPDINPVRAAAVLKGAMALFPEAGEETEAEFWAGLRPLTPDGAPVIGATPISNLFLNTGHGTLGWTLGCGSGQVIADIIGGKAPEIDVEGLGMERF